MPDKKFWLHFLLPICLVLISAKSVSEPVGQKAELVKPIWVSPPREVLYPQSKPPESKIYVLDLRDQTDMPTRFFLSTAQGVINQAVPRLYLIWKDVDRWWLDWLKKNGYLRSTIELKSTEDLLATFKVKQAIVVDPEFPATLNIATMLAGIKGIPAIFPEHVSKYQFEVVENLKGRWKTNIAAYNWAFKNLWPDMNHMVIACLAPDARLSPLRDYLVSKKIFTFWITGTKDGNNTFSSPKKEEAEIGKMLARMPVNIPVLGYPWAGHGVGIGEGGGVRLFSKHAKFLVPTDWKPNLSLWTGLRANRKSYHQLPPRNIKLDATKVYITLLMPDGDNLNTWYDYFIHYWDSPYRGTIPIAWTMGSSIYDLQPVLLDYYFSSLKETDSIGGAVSGIGYIYPEHYATAYGDHRDRIWKDFLQLTAKYMQRLDQRWIWIMNYGERKDKILFDYTEAIPGLQAMFLDYGKKKDTKYDNANYMINDVAIFHSISRFNKEQVRHDVINQVPDKRPAFLHVFLLNWNFKFEDIKELVTSLPKDYMVVRPEELSRLYKIAMKEELQ